MIRPNLFGTNWLLCGVVSLVLLPDGGRAEPSDELWGKNIAHNASFEQGADTESGWSKRRAFSMSRNVVPPLMGVVDDTARTGKKSLRMKGEAETTAWYSIESNPMPVIPGRNYRVQGWIKTLDVNPVGRQPLHCNLHARFTGSGGASVAIDGSRVVVTPTVSGTQEWTKVERIITAPEEAVEVRIGCVLTCSGTAWFDDLSFSEQLAIPWKEKDTDRITFYYEGDDAPTAEKVASTLKNLAMIESALGVKHEGKMRYYSYRSVERKKELTGNAADAHYLGEAVHVVGWDERQKLAHVVLREMGESTLFVREGLAVYLSQQVLGVDLHKYVSRQSQDEMLPSIMKLIDDGQFRQIGVDISFPAAGSFVRYLVEEHDMDKVKQLYKVIAPGEAPTTFLQKFQEIFGEDVRIVEAKWRALETPG